MFKSVRTKSNKKGFTLAELLIVVAIIAILVAIAIPIFTGALEKAQIGVNKANARSIKGAAVSEILADWDTMRIGAKDYTDPVNGVTGKGWFASGEVDADGNVKNIYVYIASYNQTTTTWTEPVVYQESRSSAGTDPLKNGTTVQNAQLSADFSFTEAAGKVKKVSDSGDLAPAYWIVVYINDVEKIEPGSDT